MIVGGDLEEELPKPIGGASNEYVQARKDVLRSVLTRTLQTERQHVFVKIYWCHFFPYLSEMNKSDKNKTFNKI